MRPLGRLAERLEWVRGLRSAVARFSARAGHGWRRLVELGVCAIRIGHRAELQEHVASEDRGIGWCGQRRGRLDRVYQGKLPRGISVAVQQRILPYPAKTVLIDLHLALEERCADRRPGSLPGAIDPGLNLADVPAVHDAQ